MKEDNKRMNPYILGEGEEGILYDSCMKLVEENYKVYYKMYIWLKEEGIIERELKRRWGSK